MVVGMDTRRMPRSNEAVDRPSVEAFETEVEVVELRHIERPIRWLAGRLAFVVLIAMLAGAIAVAGLPSRTNIAFDTPLPNFLAQPAP